VTVSNLVQVKATAQGATHSLALTTDGKIWAWGENDSGQLGNGNAVKATRRACQQLRCKRRIYRAAAI